MLKTLYLEDLFGFVLGDALVFVGGIIASLSWKDGTVCNCSSQFDTLIIPDLLKGLIVAGG